MLQALVGCVWRREPRAVSSRTLGRNARPLRGRVAGASPSLSSSFSFAGTTFTALPSKGLKVHQSPRALQASPGDTATLNCSFQNPQGSTAKATWTRGLGDMVVGLGDMVMLDSAHPFYTGRLNVSRLDLLRKGEATMTLRDLEPRDSGLYRCHISILRGDSGTGQGTKLSVTGRNQSDPDKGLTPAGCGAQEVLCPAAIALGLLFILILVVALLLKRCRGTNTAS
nr:T-cell antigen CD7-like [Pelodiscus sinensis]|eukprot:XP_025035699.1 T-cell antigen CD7-like [Pelodiscus sinensis]